MPVEDRVRPVTRHIVTRFEDGVGSKQIGEYASAEVAHDVGHALCDAERVKAGEPLDSAAFVYPGAVSGEGDKPITVAIDMPGVSIREMAKRAASSRHYWKR